MQCNIYIKFILRFRPLDIIILLCVNIFFFILSVSIIYKINVCNKLYKIKKKERDENSLTFSRIILVNCWVRLTIKISLLIGGRV